MYLIKPGKMYDFMGMRKYFLVMTTILTLGSIVTFFAPGPKWGTDFKGGTEVVIKFKKPVESAAVRQAVESIKGADGSQQFAAAEVIASQNDPTQFLIRVQEVSAISDEAKHVIGQKLCFVEGDLPAECRKADGTPNTDIVATEVKFSPGGDKIVLRYDWQLDSADNKVEVEPGKTARDLKEAPLLQAVHERLEGTSGITMVGAHPVAVVSTKEGSSKVEVHLKAKGTQLFEGIQSHFGPDVAPDAPESTEWVGPKAGAQLRDAAMKSLGIAVFFIMAYIAFRFDLRFAPGAIVSIIHDVTIALGAMVVMRKEITLSTVAAILTIVGYSLTDTVVVYDRVRENLGRHRGMTFSQIVNLSISEMFGRTIITSTTALVSMFMFLFFGTQVIKDFAFCMIVGIAVGTYSSIYVAAPVTEWVDRTFFAKKTAGGPGTRTRNPKRADAVV